MMDDMLLYNKKIRLKLHFFIQTVLDLEQKKRCFKKKALSCDTETLPAPLVVRKIIDF